MRLPYRSIGSIQPLPSIYTTFPANFGGSQSTDTPGIHSGTCLIKKIEDGIEAVPFEMSNVLSAPILSPDQEEKEVFVASWEEVDAFEKPLPSLPRCMWQRMSQRQRILALLVLQFLMLITISLSLLAIKGHSSASNQDSSVRVASDGPPSTNITNDLRRGIFALSVELSQQQSTACLTSMNQTNAWQCASNSTFQLSILPAPVGNNNSIMIAVGPPPNYDIAHHGERIPDVPPSKLLAINNTNLDDDISYHFRTTYDKVVLLSEDELSMAEELQAHPSSLNTPFQPGDNLWQCTFNETLIEGYIYPTRATSASVTNTADAVNTEYSTKLSNFPYVVKFSEEWRPNGKTPYCRRTTMELDGTLTSLSDEVLLRLEKPEDRARVSKIQRMGRIRQQKPREEAQSSGCQCQWVVS